MPVIRSVPSGPAGMVVGMFVLLIVACLFLALRTSSTLKFVTSPRRVFSQRELLWARVTGVLGVVCFLAMLRWVLHRFFNLW